MTGYNRDAWTDFVMGAEPVREVGDFQPDVIKLAKLCGFRRPYHVHDSRRSEAGFPDLILIKDGGADRRRTQG